MRRAAEYLLGLLLAVLLLWVAFRGTDLASVWERARAASLPGLLLATLVQQASFLLRVARWRTLLRPAGRRLRFGELAAATYLGYTVSFAAPGRLGELVRPGLLAARGRAAAGAALGSILVERLIDAATVLVLFAVALAVAPPGAEALARLTALRPAAVAAVVAIGLAVAALVALVAARAAIERSRLVSGGLLGWLVRAALSVAEGSRALRSPRSAARVAGESMLVWGVLLAGLWLGLRAAGAVVPFAAAPVILPLVVVGIALPTPAGTGGYHAAMTFGLARLYGVDEALAVTAAVLLHFTATLPVLAVGATLLAAGRFELESLVRLGERLRRGGVSPEGPAAGRRG